MGWTEHVSELAGLSSKSLGQLDALLPLHVPTGSVLFSPGDAIKGYVIVLEGRIGVYLVGPNGREIQLYDVVPGSSCIQSTLGLFGEEDYSAEAVVEDDARVVLLPRVTFLNLVDADPSFRRLVFSALASRLQATMHILERVAFQSVDARLAAYLLSRAENNEVRAKQQDIANAIGSAREVVSRRLDAMNKRGWASHERGHITILSPEALRTLTNDGA